MSKRLRVGVVGTGYFSQFHYDAWARMSDVQLVALATHDAKSGHETASRYGMGPVYDDIGAMLEAETLDLVDIVAPPAVHAEACRLAAESRVPAICQKPFCGGVEPARKTAAIADSLGSLLVVHENFRFQPWYGAIRAQLAAGKVGDLYQATFRLRPGDGQGAKAYLARQPYFQTMPRFLVHETAIHFIDVFRYLFGEIVAVTADLRRLNPAIAGEDAGVIIFEHESGLRTVFDGNRLADHDADDTRRTMGEMVIEGAAGTLSLDGNATLSFRAHGGSGQTPIDYDWDDQGFGGDCVYRLQRHVVAHLLDGAPLVNSAREYLRNQDVEEAVYLSAQEGRRIRV